MPYARLTRRHFLAGAVGASAALSLGPRLVDAAPAVKKGTSLSSNIFGKTKFMAECFALCALAVGFAGYAEWFFAFAIPFSILSIQGKVRELWRSHLTSLV